MIHVKTKWQNFGRKRRKNQNCNDIVLNLQTQTISVKNALSQHVQIDLWIYFHIFRDTKDKH